MSNSLCITTRYRAAHASGERNRRLIAVTAPRRISAGLSYRPKAIRPAIDEAILSICKEAEPAIES